MIFVCSSVASVGFVSGHEKLCCAGVEDDSFHNFFTHIHMRALKVLV